MKFESTIPDSKEIPSIHSVAEKRKGLSFLGTLRIHKGHNMYELDINNRWIQEAAFEPEIEISKGRFVKKRLVIRPGCLYVSALNIVNAERKFKKKFAKHVQVRN